MKMKKFVCYFTGLTMAMSLAACGNNQKKAEQKKTPAAVTSAVPAQPAAQAPAAAASPVKGKVLEVKDASGYTYIRLDNGSKDGIWAAIPKSDLKVGEEVTLQGGAVMENFTSKTLGKTFDKIIFASGVLRAGDKAAGDFASAAAAGSGAAAMSSGGSAGSIVPFKNLKITKATGPNAHTVGELYAQRKALNSKHIVVRGQVVKISKNIMGKNWIHIQDGTGNPMQNTHDLVITTQDVAAKGDIVTVTGVVEADKDFGSGYKYDVIIEQAKVVKDAAPKGAK